MNWPMALHPRLASKIKRHSNLRCRKKCLMSSVIVMNSLKRYHNTSMFVWIEKEKSVLLILKEQLYSLAHVIITLAPITQFSNRKRHSSLLAFLYPELTTQVLDFILSYRLFQWIYWILEQRTLSNLSPMTLKITLKD